MIPRVPTDLLVQESSAMKTVVESIESCADGDVPVLIEGEPGTGRELVARVIHLTSARRLQSFVIIKGGTAPTGTFSDQMTSASRSAFRSAQGGTLLVKDLCALPRKSQHRLDSVLSARRTRRRDDSTGEVFDVRLVATTDPDLECAVTAGVFEETLYKKFRKRIVIPPLRERSADIAPLAAKLVRGYGKTMGRKRMRVSTRAFERMIAYSWPGNVAELKVVCRRLALTTDGKVEAEHIDSVLPRVAERTPLEDMSFEDMVTAKLSEFLRQMEGYPLDGLYEEVLARVERPLFSLILERTGQNQVKAAEILGVSRNTLRRKLVERGIKPKTKGTRRAPARAKSKRKTG